MQTSIAGKCGTMLVQLADDSARWETTLTNADNDAELAAICRDRIGVNERLKAWLLRVAQTQKVLPLISSDEAEPAPQRKMQCNVVARLSEIAPNLSADNLVKAGAMLSAHGERNAIALALAVLLQADLIK